MEKVRVLAFDVNSSLAIFRKSYTTTSALTFSIPPFSSLRGLVGAILGLKYGEMQEKLKPALFGVQVLSEIVKTRIMTNLINTKISIAPLGIGGAPRIQVRAEYVHEPRYRVYCSIPDNKLMDDLKENLIQHKSYFTPYLGSAYCIANFQWVGEYFMNPRKLSTEIEVLTAVPKKWIKKMNVVGGRRYMVERLPSHIDKYRTPEEYIDMVFDAGGQPIQGKFLELLYELGTGNYIALI